MNNFKFSMLTNIIIYAVYIICVTFAACFFGKPALLVWYVLVIFLGSACKEEPNIEVNINGNDK